MERFSRTLFGSTALLSFLITAVASAAAVFYGRAFWLTGMWAAFLWFLVKTFLLHVLFQIAAQNDAGSRKKIAWICVVKFPVLYVIGLGLLVSPAVSNTGILAGFNIYVAAFLIAAFLQKVFKPKQN